MCLLYMYLDVYLASVSVCMCKSTFFCVYMCVSVLSAHCPLSLFVFATINIHWHVCALKCSSRNYSYLHLKRSPAKTYVETMSVVDTVTEKDMLEESADRGKRDVDGGIVRCSLERKPRYILMGGIKANLHEIYGSTMNKTFNIFLKKGNFRFVPGNITINVQKQLMDLGVTYKPFGTHITAARIPDDTSRDRAITWCKQIAANLGDRTWSITLSPYGSHSVQINGELEKAIRHQVSKFRKNSSPWQGNVSIPSPIHVELRPRLQKDERYVEVKEAWYDSNIKQVRFAGIVQLEDK